MSNKKTIYETVQETHAVDPQTGEVYKTSSNSIKVTAKKVTSNEFFKLYLKDHKELLNLKDKEYKFVGALAHIINFNTNTYVLLKDDKEVLGKMIGVTAQSISNLNTALVNKGIVKSTARGKYIIDPKYMFRGDELKHDDVVVVYSQYIIDDNAPLIEQDQVDIDIANS